MISVYLLLDWHAADCLFVFLLLRKSNYRDKDWWFWQKIG